jgi:Family of unknown function (DUF6134)
MIDRRELLVGAGVMAALPVPAWAASGAALPIPPGDRLGFDIIRKGSRLGAHVLTFERSGNDLVVRVTMELVVKAAFITLYRYTHSAVERWSGDQVVALDTKTDDSGTKYVVSARRTPAGLVIEATGKPKFVAPADASPATHWNRRQLDGPWINTQDGKIFRPKVTPAGAEAIPTAKAGPVKANRYALTGDVAMDLWYDARPSWAGLSFTGKDGSVIKYVRQ